MLSIVSACKLFTCHFVSTILHNFSIIYLFISIGAIGEECLETVNFVISMSIFFKYILQVLSKTVANAIESMGRDEMASTVHFINKLNDWFDCLNVANVTQHIQSKNPNLAPYRSIDDERLKVQPASSNIFYAITFVFLSF